MRKPPASHSDYTPRVARVSPTIDLYALLGVERTASASEVKAAYERLASAHQPQRNPGKASAQYLQLLNFAYRHLSDPQKRQLYDDFGNKALRVGFDAIASRRARQTGNYGSQHGAQSYRWQAEAPASSQPQPSSSAPSLGWMGAMAKPPSSSSKPSFRWLGEWSKPPSSQEPGSFSWLGAQGPRTAVPDDATNNDEDNSQARNRKTSKKRPSARKRNPIRTQVSRGNRKSDKPSRKRKGPDITTTVSLSFKQAVRGGKIALPATQAAGEKLTVETPPGLQTGATLRVEGQGGKGEHGGARGDLLLEVTVRRHRYFRRDGDNLRVDLPITLKEAVLGAKVVVPTPHGKVSLTIFPRTQTGRVLRLRGRGIHREGFRAGDLYVRILVLYPAGSSVQDLLKLLPHQEDVRADWP